MDVGHGHEIGCYGRLVGLFEAGVGEWARNEKPRGRIGWWRRLMRMERSSIVSRRAKLISGGLC